MKAFNRRAYAAVFVSQEPILDLPELLQDPRAFGITLERDVSRTEELVRRSRNPVKVRGLIPFGQLGSPAELIIHPRVDLVRELCSSRIASERG